MWCFFEDGTFYSAVENTFKGGTGKNVRSRDLRSAKLLAEWVAEFSDREVDVLKTNSADYRFRVILTDYEWTNFVTMKAETAKAKNFKSEVAKNIGYTEGKKFLNALHDVWQVMYDYQNGRSRHTSAFGPVDLEADCFCDIDYLDPDCTNPEHIAPPTWWVATKKNAGKAKKKVKK